MKLEKFEVSSSILLGYAPYKVFSSKACTILAQRLTEFTDQTPVNLREQERTPKVFKRSILLLRNSSGLCCVLVSNFVVLKSTWNGSDWKIFEGFVWETRYRRKWIHRKTCTYWSVWRLSDAKAVESVLMFLFGCPIVGVFHTCYFPHLSGMSGVCCSENRGCMCRDVYVMYLV